MSVERGGQNLFRERHPEHAPNASRVERNLYLRRTFRFQAPGW
ncbi:MAG: hypothetical protein M5U26_12225 [Planctomycetota bacterium]|nr:hypothetical protein [Planctomycetota bacterium]